MTGRKEISVACQLNVVSRHHNCRLRGTRFGLHKRYRPDDPFGRSMISLCEEGWMYQRRLKVGNGW